MCLFARLATPRAPSGLYSAVLNLDHGLPEPTRVYRFPGYLSEHVARAAGIRFAAALGRAVIAD
jgi:hypothetical protein